ncbi:peptidase M3 [Oceanobacillus neutriphilus]|uniref:Oligoendopeptidase F n=1 Tax=Oceanobacillus neutriphilus TaxID=531815 RepID=A0ABQ2NW81_9BACI|nr:peptidase M3 [Oceanobacillus neutriphilus]GGP12148.1 oligoendopeptidase F [Oceanobacillus neutriphilus]
METFNTQMRWDLDKLLCGFDIDKFKNYLKSIKDKLLEIEKYMETNILNERELIIISQAIKKIESAESFYYCLTAEDISFSLLTPLQETILDLKTQVHLIKANLQNRLRNMNNRQFDDWSENIHQKEFITELLKDAEITSDEERVTADFTRDTLSFLEGLYEQMRNKMRIKTNLNSDEAEISFAEASNLSLSHSEQSERIHVFRELNKTLETEADLFASVYNQMVGLRLRENKVRKVDYLDESLKKNGISQPTLNAMWEAVDANIEELSSYLRTKAGEAETKNISWHQLMTSSQPIAFEMTFSEAIEGIIQSLGNIDSDMCEFVRKAIVEGWVDAERRETKSLGGFCAPFLLEEESRISLNYDNSIDSARRLAHELGHAWHFQQMKYAPSLLFSDDTFEMTMAETSSIFFETAFIDYVIQNTNDSSVKKAILASRIERSLNYLMSIRGAFLFEKKFYEYRKDKQLDAKQIEELSRQSQEKAYGNSLSEYEPFVWMKYGQFYQASNPFYNYPYSFGFLLSIGLLELAKKDELFSQKFKGFLSETGMMPMEQLVKKHFQLDFRQQAFWQQSIQRLVQDIEEYNKY